VKSRRQPFLQPGFRLAQINVGDANLLKSQLPPPSLDRGSEIGW
jgi:hypothetical protein